MAGPDGPAHGEPSAADGEEPDASDESDDDDDDGESDDGDDASDEDEDLEDEDADDLPAGLENRFFSLAAMEAFAAEDEEIIASGPPEPSDSDDESGDDESDGDAWAGDEDAAWGKDATYDDFFDDADDYARAVPSRRGYFF